MFENLASKIPTTKIASNTGFSKIIPYDGSPWNLFFAKHGISSERIPQILTNSQIGNALIVPRGYPIIIKS